MKPFRPEHYFDAAQERIDQAQGLYLRGKSFALAMYVAGVAVECILRALKGRKTKTLDERHDLERLFKNSGFILTQEASSYPAVAAAINAICVLWTNDSRYASEARMLAHLKKDPALRVGLKGDILKAIAGRLIDAAQLIVNEGVKQWRSSRKPEGS